MRVVDGATKTVKWDYNNSEHFITRIAFICGEPEWIKIENGVQVGLYVIGKEKYWIEKAKVDERKDKPFPCEATIDEVADLIANKLIIDEKTNEVKFRFLLEDGRIAEYTSAEIIKKRSEGVARKFRELKHQECEVAENEL